MMREQGISVRFVLALLAVLALVATACSNSDSTSSDSAAGEDTSGERSAEGLDEGDAQTSDEEEAFAADSLDERQEADVVEGGAQAGEAEAAEESMADDAAAEAGAPQPTPGADSFAEAADGGGLFDDDEPPPPPPSASRDNRFENYGIRDFVETSVDPLSTFALDVDTGSYSVGRQWLTEGSLPPIDSVRVEEYVNAFDYGYRDPDDVLGIEIDGGPSPFDDDNHIVRIGVQAQRLDDDERPDASLTFVIDTSGSMEQGGRLELVKEALEELVDELGGNDQVAIVEFDDDPSIVLDPTDADDEDEIVEAIDELRPGGSTNVEAGLALGYELAGDMYDDDRVNRVILLSDGVANQGLTDPDALSRMIREDADRGIQLLTVGVGMGNFNDVLMEQLADQGDGFYAYVDTDDEAERLFEDNLTSTLVTLAIDAKIQVEFDPEVVEAYRLIGFENRGVRDSDFRNNDVDAGEVGAGHQVTAIYEIELERGVELDGDELGEVHLRWEEPGTGSITETETDIELDTIEASWSRTTDSFKLAVVVATFAEVLRDSPFADDIDLDDLEEEAEDLADRMDERAVDELADLVALAERYS